MLGTPLSPVMSSKITGVSPHITKMLPQVPCHCAPETVWNIENISLFLYALPNSFDIVVLIQNWLA